MGKINLVEILKDCPKGMELDCTLYENVEFDYIEQSPELAYPIHCITKTNGGYNALVFTHNGCNDRHPNAKCVIFPKGKTTWEGFVPPCKFKDGDIISDSLGTCIFKGEGEFEGTVNYYCGISNDYFQVKDDKRNPSGHYGCIVNYRFATEEEKQKLFDAIKANGYKWNAETKTLEKLPMFKGGDRIRLKSKPNYVYTIHSLTWDDNNKLAYRLLPDNDKHLRVISLIEQNEYELIPNKFDFNSLVPFESRVLIRDSKSQKWSPAIWGFYDSDSQDYRYKLVGIIARYCIPYEGNEHLLGKTNDCDEFYKTWK